MLTVEQYEAIKFGSPEKFERLRPAIVKDPYDPDAVGVPDWDQPEVAEFLGFISQSTSTVLPDSTREQTQTTAILTVDNSVVDIKVGDRVRQGERIWQVTGNPSLDMNPFTGWRPTTEIQLAEYVG